MDYLDLGYSSSLQYGGANNSELSPLDAGDGTSGSVGGASTPTVQNQNTEQVDPARIGAGNLAAQLDMAQFSYIKGGADGYNLGSGFYMGWDKTLSKYVFFFGDSSGDNIKYDGTNLSLTGSFSANSIHVPDEDTTTNSAHINSVGNTWWGATSTDFAANNKNAPAYVLNTGDAYFQNVEVNGVIKTAVFEKDVVSAVGGQLVVANADALDVDMTALDSSTLTIKGETTLALNSIVHIKDGTDEEYLRVTNVGSAPTYTVTRDLAGAYSSNDNPAWKAGTAIVVEGISDGTLTYSGGWLRLLGSGTNAPRYGVFKRTGVAYNAVTEVAGFGNLNGLVGYVADEYGVAIGSSSAYMTYDQTNGLRIEGAASVNGSALGFQDIFGDGSDGDVTISVDTSLSRDMFYDDLTVTSNSTLNPNGYRIFVKGTLTIDSGSKIARNGSNGGNGGNASGPTAGSGGSAGAALADGSIKGAVAGQAGGRGEDGSSAANGTNGTSVAKSITAAAGVGGGGGYDPGGGTFVGSSSGGSVTGTAFNYPRTITAAYLLYDFLPSGDSLKTSGGSGSGAGGRRGAGATRAGGGGGGSASPGGIVSIFAKRIVATGNIEAKGGTGGNGGNASSVAGVAAAGGGGGGGGGSGGVVILVYGIKTGAGTISVSGGAGGSAGFGSSNGATDASLNGQAGTTGGSGVVIQLQA